MAQWLTSPKNPLTSRVIVNRVWHHLFGQGLVTTVDNFGVNSETTLLSARAGFHQGIVWIEPTSGNTEIVLADLE